MNQNAYKTLDQWIIPTGGEHKLLPALEEILRDTDCEITGDNMHNAVVHKKGCGQKLVVAAPCDSLGFTVRYIGADKVFLHLDEADHQQFVGKELIFPDGQTAVLETDEKNKQFARLADTGALMQGSGAQLAKNTKISADTGWINGVDIQGTVNLYTLIKLIKTVDSKKDLYFVFTTQNRLTKTNPGGKTLALKNLDGDLVLWLDTVFCKKETICLEAGDGRYILDKRVKEQVRLAAEAAGEEMALCVDTLGGDVAEIIENTGKDAAGLVIPATGSILEGSVDLRNVEAMINTITEVLIG